MSEIAKLHLASFIKKALFNERTFLEVSRALGIASHLHPAQAVTLTALSQVWDPRFAENPVKFCVSGVMCGCDIFVFIAVLWGLVWLASVQNKTKGTGTE